MIELSVPEYTNTPLEECLLARRSLRQFRNEEIPQTDISLLVWAAQGVTSKRGFRTTPSAGATYPLELFLATADGLFRYVPQHHALKQESGQDLRHGIATRAFNQMFIADAGVVFVITGIFERTTWRYGERGVQYVHNEVGHCAQNIHLQAVALGLGSVPIGAFNRPELKELLELDDEEPLYIIPVGYPK